MGNPRVLITGPHPKGIEESRTRDHQQLTTISNNFTSHFRPIELTLLEEWGSLNLKHLE